MVQSFIASGFTVDPLLRKISPQFPLLGTWPVKPCGAENALPQMLLDDSVQLRQAQTHGSFLVTFTEALVHVVQEIGYLLDFGLVRADAILLPVHRIGNQKEAPEILEGEEAREPAGGW